MKTKTPHLTIFDWIKNIINNKKNWENFSDEDKKSFNNYLIHRFLSMNPKYIEIVNYVQKLNIKDNKKMYEVYCYFIPQSKNTYSPYIKSNIKKSINPELSKHVSEHFECSLGEADEYISLLRKEGVEDILIKRGVDDKEIKKLLKNG